MERISRYLSVSLSLYDYEYGVFCFDGAYVLVSTFFSLYPVLLISRDARVIFGSPFRVWRILKVHLISVLIGRAVSRSENCRGNNLAMALHFCPPPSIVIGQTSWLNTTYTHTANNSRGCIYPNIYPLTAHTPTTSRQTLAVRSGHGWPLASWP